MIFFLINQSHLCKRSVQCHLQSNLFQPEHTGGQDHLWEADVGGLGQVHGLVESNLDVNDQDG